MKKQDKRINKILEILLEYMQKDFSHVIPVSEKGDEWDAIAVGLNTMREELWSHIQQLKENEEKLKEYEHFFYNSYDLSCVANVQGYFEILNPNFEKVLGYSEKELLENQFLNFIHPDDIASTLQEIEKLKTGAVTINFVNRFRKKDGSYLWFDWNSTPDAARGKLYAIARDITERKKTDEKTKQLNAELEQKVIERTAKLSKAESEIRNFAKHLNKVLEEERAHIAREIHDEVGQQLAGIKIGLSSLKKLEGAGKITDEIVHPARLGSLSDRVNTMMSDMDITIQSLRKIATELRPGILDTLGLIPSIEWLANEFEKKKGIRCTLELNVKEQKFEQNISTCFFRICQESLTNIAKHAQANEIKIKATQNDKELLLEISDNGKGIASEKLENPFSMGLLGMRERANIIGAELKIETKKNQGTIIQLKTSLN